MKDSYRSINLKKRIITLDVIRTVAIVLVVACHSIQQTIPFLGISGDGRQFVNYPFIKQFVMTAIFILGRTGVPLFLILSGYLMIDRPFTVASYLKHFLWHNLLSLLVCFEIWTGLYQIFIYLVFKVHISIKDYLFSFLFLNDKSFQLFSKYLWHYWYIPAIIGLYLVLPFLANSIVKANKSLLASFLIVSIFFSMIVPDVNSILEFAKKMQRNTTLSVGLTLSFSAVYFVFGNVLKRGLLKKWTLKWLSIIGILSFVILVFGSLYINGSFSVSNAPAFCVWYTNPILLIFSLVIFELLTRIPDSKKLSSFTILSELSLGVYLVHRPIQILLQKSQLINFNTGVNFLILLVSTLLISYFLVWLISLIPLVKRMLLNIK
ncbi:acyltransferase [Furfurilactobacillus cerevisiae]|uniref:acyltransferase n=1 Tax=Furfurilactobacillus rossiae TaxID=231049 RepID=UPI003B982363